MRRGFPRPTRAPILRQRAQEITVVWARAHFRTGRAVGLGLALALSTSALHAEDIRLPSGQTVSLIEVLSDVPGQDALAIRYRFLAPAIARDGGTIDAETAGKDMDWLCTTYALPRLPKSGPLPGEIVISLSDRKVPFGQEDPAATQLFTAYQLQDGACQPEDF